MTQLIAMSFLTLGLSGMVVILIRKIPVLAELPLKEKKSKQSLSANFKKYLGNISFIKSFSIESILQKILSRIRILTLRVENKTANWLQLLRERSSERTRNFHDGYWKKLKEVNKKRGKKSSTENKLV
jgi:hypothetical protein